jgi:streptomycin 6-kinase
VLKVQLPDDVEAEHEADALRFWDGRAAVKLLAHDRARRALLLERCVPGTSLGAEFDDEAIIVAAQVMRRLWRAPPDDVAWRQLEVEAERWLDELPARYEQHGRPFERRLLDAGLDAIRTLAPTQDELVVCHQDLHCDNILRAEREPWLAIDPKPIAAERAYDTVPIIRDRLPKEQAIRDVRRRLDALAELLDLDRERMKGWGIAKHLAWNLTADAVDAEGIEEARLMAAA